MRAGFVVVGLALALAVLVAVNTWRHARDAAVIDTFERAQDADLSTGDADADLEWLRRRGK